MLIEKPPFLETPSIEQIRATIAKNGRVPLEGEVERTYHYFIPIKLEIGIYSNISIGFNFPHLTMEEEYPPLEFGKNKSFHCYGVCDSVEQFKSKIGKYLIKDKNKLYLVGMTHMPKKEQPPEGGWRWHKWGPYIGNGKPTCEYLYDEEKFEDGVWIYHVYDVSRYWFNQGR